MQRRYGRSLILFTIACSMCFTLISRSWADQPKQEWSTVEVPVYVLIDDQGRAELVTALWGPAKGTPEAVLSKVLPESIPIFTDIGEFDLVRGVACFSKESRGDERFEIDEPLAVRMQPDGPPILDISTLRFNLARGVNTQESGSFMTFASPIHTVPVVGKTDNRRRAQDHARNRSAIRLNWNDNQYSAISTMDRVPGWLEYGKDNNTTIKYCRASKRLNLHEQLRSVPAVTRNEEGPLLLGAQQINDVNADNFIDAIVFYAMSIRSDHDGQYFVEIGGKGRTVTGVKMLYRSGAPKHSSVSGTHTVNILPEDGAKDLHAPNPNQRGGVSFIFDEIDIQLSPGFSENELRAVMHESAKAFNCFNNTATIRINVTFSNQGPLGPNTKLMATTPDFSFETYGGAISSLALQASNNNENEEQVIYTSFPIGSVPFEFSTGVTTGVVGILRQTSLRQAAGGQGSAFADAEILINSNSSIHWDLNAKDGLAADHFDFRGIFLHELFHAMGFTCRIDNFAVHPIPSNNIPWLWDLFRFKTQSVGNFVDTAEFMNSPRQLIRGTESVAATLKDQSSGIYDLATGEPVSGLGDGWQAGHFKVASDRSNLIGIMDAKTEAGRIHFPKLADYRALDILGWNLDPTNCVPLLAPVIINQFFPVNESTGVELETFLGWTTNGSEDSTTVVIWDPMGTEVLNESVISDQFFQVPPGVLDYDTTYEWAAFTVNGDAVGQSEYWTFTTEAEVIIPPGCPADINMDGIVDTADLGALIGSFGNTGTPGNVFGDINEDGVVDTADLGILVATFGPCPV